MNTFIYLNQFLCDINLPVVLDKKLKELHKICYPICSDTISERRHHYVEVLR